MANPSVEPITGRPYPFVRYEYVKMIPLATAKFNTMKNAMNAKTGV
jgi:hypothetical protein